MVIFDKNDDTIEYFPWKTIQELLGRLNVEFIYLYIGWIPANRRGLFAFSKPIVEGKWLLYY